MKAKNNDFKLLKVLSDRLDGSRGVYELVELREYNGKKFKFIFTNSNGTPLGFDYKHCIDVFNVNNDSWQHLADKSDILAFSNHDIDCSSYYGSAEKLDLSRRYFMDACCEYLKVLYS